MLIGQNSGKENLVFLFRYFSWLGWDLLNSRPSKLGVCFGYVSLNTFGRLIKKHVAYLVRRACCNM